MKPNADQSEVHQHCSEQQLRRALKDSLEELEEQFMTAHLSDCDFCRQKLEALAADGDTWSRAAGWLGSERPASSHGSPRPISGLLSEDDASDADFAVQFLSPGTTPDSLGRLGDIDIREFIGRGAMGIVLRGWQAELSRFVAVKVMSPYLAVSGAARKRFEREAQAAAAILHPNVMPIHSVSSTARLPYLVMPFLACESLQQRLNREGPLPLIEQLQIAVQVARGLAAAHAQGLVHRDVKPANILLERGVDRVMLTDFGLARAVDDASLTRSGVITGTPQYMSPEQARGEPVDQRSDLFSFGSVMYAMATGRAPFRAESCYGILRRLCESTPRAIREINPEVPDWLAALVERLHARDREVRIQSAAEVAEILEQCLAHLRQPDSTPLPAACLRPSQRPVAAAGRRGWKLPSVIVGTVLLAAIVGFAAWLTPVQRPQEKQLAQPSESLPLADPPLISAGHFVDAVDADVDRELIELRRRVESLEAELQDE